jgi:hypothetical protein
VTRWAESVTLTSDNATLQRKARRVLKRTNDSARSGFVLTQIATDVQCAISTVAVAGDDQRDVERAEQRAQTGAMWREHGADGVAICSRYVLLKAALENADGRPHMGLVRYGADHLTGWNDQRFISTKRAKYVHEKEVRAVFWILDLLAGINRHFDVDNNVYDRPLSPPRLVNDAGFTIPIRPSDLTRYRDFLPSDLLGTFGIS